MIKANYLDVKTEKLLFSADLHHVPVEGSKIFIRNYHGHPPSEALPDSAITGWFIVKKVTYGIILFSPKSQTPDKVLEQVGIWVEIEES